MSTGLRRYIALFLSFWIALTSVGVSLDVHYCNGEIYSLGLNSAADKCSGFVSSYPFETSKSINKSPCCGQFIAHIQNDIESANEEVAFQLEMPSYVFQYAVHGLEGLLGKVLFQTTKRYLPPEREVDLLLRFSVLRI
jgi:hypothetical protein